MPDGRSRRIMPLDKNNFAPRLGLAWTPRIFGLNEGQRSVVVRANYGLSYLPITGDDRRPLPDLGGQVSGGFGALSGAIDPTYIMRLCCNGPNYHVANPLLNIPSNGVIGMDSLAYSVADSFAVSPLFRTPYTHLWNLAIESGIARNTSLTLQYDGSFGYLFRPQTNLNVGPGSYLDALLTANLDPNATVLDPLGRKNAAGQPLTVRLGTLTNPFMGFIGVYERYRTDARNFRNAGSVFLRRRSASGLNGTMAYTFGKTLNDAADAGTDNSGFASGMYQAGYSGKFDDEYAVAVYDITHSFNSTFYYELPFGSRGRVATEVEEDGPAIRG